MIKILTYINTAALVVAVGGGTFAYFNRGKITESIMNEVQKQLPSLVKGARLASVVAFKSFNNSAACAL